MNVGLTVSQIPEYTSLEKTKKNSDQEEGTQLSSSLDYNRMRRLYVQILYLGGEKGEN